MGSVYKDRDETQKENIVHTRCMVMQKIFSMIIVTTYPSTTGWRKAHRCVFLGRKTHRVATNVYSRKMSEKPKTRSTNFKNKRLGVVFTHREGISIPRVRHKGQQPLIKCAKSWLLIHFIFPFLCFLSFGVDKSGAFAPTYPQLWWGTQTNVVLWKARKLCGVLILDF